MNQKLILKTIALFHYFFSYLKILGKNPVGKQKNYWTNTIFSMNFNPVFVIPSIDTHLAYLAEKNVTGFGKDLVIKGL